MKILAVGCSFTFGMELPDCPASTYNSDKTPSEFAYPAVLANKLTADLTNLSLPGGSNGRTFRTVLDNSVKEKYDLIICQWTDIGRADLRYEGKDFPVTASSRWLDNDFPWITEYFKKHYDPEHSYQIWITQAIALQNHFKLLGQRYVFLSMMSMQDKQGKKFPHLIEQIDADNYLGWETDEAMVNWMGLCPKGPGGHPLELGHERIAEKIYEHLSNRG